MRWFFALRFFFLLKTIHIAIALFEAKLNPDLMLSTHDVGDC